MPPTATTPPTLSAVSAPTSSITSSAQQPGPQSSSLAQTPPPASSLPTQTQTAPPKAAAASGVDVAVSPVSGKAVTAADQYDPAVTLCAELREQAERELRETDAVRVQALAAMREWIEQNPRLERVRFGEFHTRSVPLLIPLEGWRDVD